MPSPPPLFIPILTFSRMPFHLFPLFSLLTYQFSVLLFPSTLSFLLLQPFPLEILSQIQFWGWVRPPVGENMSPGITLLTLPEIFYTPSARPGTDADAPYAATIYR